MYYRNINIIYTLKTKHVYMNNHLMRDLDYNILPGDTVYYFDLYGNKKGFGVFVRFIINQRFPLTKRKLLLKNIKTGRYWAISEIHNNIKYSEHRTSNNTAKLVKIILKDL